MAKLRISVAERKLIKNYNAKITRNLKRGVSTDLLPDKVTVSEFKSRKEFNRFKDSAKWFLNRSNTAARYVQTNSGYFVTQRDINKLKSLQKRATSASKKYGSKYDDYKFRVLAEEIAGVANMTTRTVGMDRIKDKPMQFTRNPLSFDTPAQFEGYVNLLNRRIQPDYFIQKDNQMKENLKTAVMKTFGSDGQNIINKIDFLSMNDFLEFFYTTDFDFSFIYNREDYNRKLNTLNSYVNTFVGD